MQVCCMLTSLWRFHARDGRRDAAAFVSGDVISMNSLLSYKIFRQLSDGFRCSYHIVQGTALI